MRVVVGVLLLLAATAHAQEYSSTVHARARREDAPVGTVVMTARELSQRNVQNLAQALELIPALQVRQGGMGVRLDLRGAKQRSILLLIDGIPIDEPYFGAFDLTAIPVTDIVEIRVQLSPASPLEGPGGDGGIIEVFTLRAVGGRRLHARLVGSTDPDFEGAATGRVPLKKDETLGLRASVGGRYAEPGHPVTDLDGSPRTFYNRQLQAYAGTRLEHQGKQGRVALDAWYGHRSFSIPPSETEGAQVQHVNAEDAARLVLGGEANVRGLRIAAGAYGQFLSRDIDFFGDYTLTQKTAHQFLTTVRTGAALTLDRAWARGKLLANLSARLSFDGEWARIEQTGAQTAWGLSTYGALAVGARIRWRMLRAEAAVGLLLPFDRVESLWPEAKLALGLEPSRYLGLFLVAARKGRLPTVRELYDPLQGNPALGPEQTWHGELRLELRPHALVYAHTTAYVKQVEGFIRLDPFSDSNRRNLNLDTILIRGFEAAIDVARERILGGGIAYLYQDADSVSLGLEPIANLPGHRVDAYLSSTWKRQAGAILRFRWVSERVVQRELLDPYHVIDLTLWSRISDEIRASLRINNLSDQRYQMLPGLRVLGVNALFTVEGAWQ
jgi:outer membrane receptor protein involved in Fe transport